jgi:hypothetical protein
MAVLHVPLGTAQMGLKIPLWRLHFLESVFLHMVGNWSLNMFFGRGRHKLGPQYLHTISALFRAKNCLSFLKTGAGC